MATGTIKHENRYYTSLTELGLSASNTVTQDIFNALPDGSMISLQVDNSDALANELGYDSAGGAVWMIRVSRWRVIGLAASYNGRAFRFLVMYSGGVPKWSDNIDFTISK